MTLRRPIAQIVFLAALTGAPVAAQTCDTLTRLTTPNGTGQYNNLQRSPC